MKTKYIILLTIAMIIFISSASLASEVSWSGKEQNPDSLRIVVGLPSIALGNLNPSARNPGMEFLCTGLYDDPGGYCYYFANGVPYIDSTFNETITSGVTK